MSGHTPADLAFAAGFALRYFLVTGICIVLAGVISGRLMSARGGGHGG